MWSRLYFTLACALFLVMNWLLFRTEFGGRDFAVAIPVESVVQTLFESADASALEIRHRGAKIGYCRWSSQPRTLQPPPANTDTNQILEGMVTGITGYDVDFDGSLTAGDDQRLRFDISFEVDTNYNWNRFQGRVQSRPWRWEVLALAPEQSIEFAITRDDQSRRHAFSLAELEDPSQILAAMGGPLLANSFKLFGLGPDPFAEVRELSLGLEWTAHTDRQKIGNTALSVYRLQTRLFDQYHIVIYLLQSGELLRVELPNDIVLVNDELTSL